MKIKRLEVQGFKSFADRTVLRFGDGITGVLGPNGCGKSNIVDAIRWAMGEQSAKHLRGGAMDDVIFAGSDSRGPMGMAEVTITFKNDDNLVPPEYQHLSEISITRRLFRDGTSQYLMNKQPCLLRDINELFMGTGIGRNSYAIIEQGRIGLVVTAKPEDRRTLIEDAAGITKYKARRKQAERRLEATESNLLRVSDIVGELKKRIGSLERQAKKAEEYKALKSELKELDLCAAVHRHLELSALERLEASQVSLRQGELSEQEEAISTEEARISEAQETLAEAERGLRAKEARLRELEQALAVGAKNVEHLERELEGLKGRRSDAERERELLNEQLTEARVECAELDETAKQLGTSTGEERTRLEQEQEKLQEIEIEIGDMESTLERHKQLLVDCLTKIAEHENDKKNLERSAIDVETRRTRIADDLEEATQQANKFESDASESKEKLDSNRQLKLALEDKKVGQERMLERYQTEFMANEAQLLGLREQLMDKRSRLMSLEEIQRNYEGCQAGVRALMRRRETDPNGENLHGLVADVISAEPRFETAVEAVLGERLQYMIVSSQDDGVASIDYLKESEVGRGTFIPLDLREDHASWAPRRSSSGPPESISDLPPPAALAEEARLAQAALHRAPLDDAVPPGMGALPVPEAVFDEDDLWPDLDASGVCGKMIDLVDANPGFEHVKRVLLGDIVVVEDLENARALWRSNGHRKTLVTLDGEVLDPVGVITGGATDGVSAGMLAQKREIKELSDDVQSLDARVKLAEDRHKTLKAQITSVEQAIQGLSRDGHQEDLSILELEKDIRAFRETAARHAERMSSLQRDLAAIEADRANLAEELDRSGVAIVELTQRRAEAGGRVEEATHALNARKVEAQEVSAGVTELKVAVAAAAEKREGSERSLARIASRIEEIEMRIERLASNITQSGAESERLARTIEDSKGQGVTLEGDIETRATELDELMGAHSEAVAQLREEDTAVREQRRELDEVKGDLTTATVRLREHQISREALHEQIDDRYQIALIDVVTDYHLSALQSADSAERRGSLRRKIDRMGEINLTAIREFEEVSERYNFLTGQKSDLDRAIADLRLAIRKIDATSKQRFLDAFELVKEKFELVFPRLFNGGRATLLISDESNPLESGIEMYAQPPGKNLQSVNLLSGGEKALTAISLIFSIFLIKPTPFCLLDEVDAPLDDANVGRYNDMVRDMAQLSQFILITHNKRTMEIPDRLYGVTMEEPGISKLVSVDLKEEKKPEAPRAAS